MFKRANKITALLVAAASVMSIVPAMAADSTRLGTKEGTITNAVAFKDGKYVYEGYRTSSDDKSVYYNAGDKDKDLTDLTDADLQGAYSDKYAFAVDGSDEYLVDLTSGSIIDDNTPEDIIDNASTKLKSALKKTDRYGDTITVDSANLTELAGAKFGETFYQYAVAPVATDGLDYADTTNTKLYGYTNDAGKYIDTSYTANVYAYSSAKDKVVKIENFSSKANDEDTDTKLQATLVDAPEFIGQDKDNIYQKVTVSITDTNATGTTGDVKAKAVINWTAAQDAAMNGVKAKLTLNLSQITATDLALGSDIIINGLHYTGAAAADFTKAGTALAPVEFVAGDKNSLIAAVTSKMGTEYTYSNGVFTEKVANGTGATVTVGTAGDTHGVTTGVVGVEPEVTIAGHTFNLAAGDYSNLTTLKAAVKAYFTTGAGATAGVVTDGGVSFVYDETSTFNAATAGAVTEVIFDETNATNNTAGVLDFTDGSVSGSTGVDKTWTATYIQKISKAQGETKDDAYLPKTVASYELTSGLDCGDADDAVDADDAATSYQVANGTLYAVKNTGSNVKVTTMKLVKDKVKFDAATLPAGHDIADKVDVYLVEKGDDDDTDISSAGAVSADVDGNIWALHDGKIYKFEGSEFKQQFTCDGALDELDVYDATSLVAWENDGDVYTTVNEGTKVTQDEAAVVAPVVVAPVTGWVKGTDGTWTFNDYTGAKVTSKWVNVGGAWYYLKADGIMATGWQQDGGTWYYLNASGSMATGWINDNGTWYYLAASGAMLANTTVDGYKLGASGAWVK